jgi:hypothetical protein
VSTSDYAQKAYSPSSEDLCTRWPSTYTKITLWQAVERALGYGESMLEGGFGFFQYFLHHNRCCVHDRIAETIVIQDQRQVDNGWYPSRYRRLFASFWCTCELHHAVYPLAGKVLTPSPHRFFHSTSSPTPPKIEVKDLIRTGSWRCSSPRSG